MLAHQGIPRAFTVYPDTVGPGFPRCYEEHRIMMELTYIYSVVSRAILLCSMLIANRCGQLAQMSEQTPRGPHSGHAHAANDNGARANFELRILTERLSLNDDQQVQVKSALAEQEQEFAELREEMRNDPDAPGVTGDKLRAIRQTTDAKVAALLSEEQQARFAVWVDERNAAIEHRRYRHETPSAPEQVGEPLSLI